MALFALDTLLSGLSLAATRQSSHLKICCVVWAYRGVRNTQDRSGRRNAECRHTNFGSGSNRVHKLAVPRKRHISKPPRSYSLAIWLPLLVLNGCLKRSSASLVYFESGGRRHGGFDLCVQILRPFLNLDVLINSPTLNRRSIHIDKPTSWWLSSIWESITTYLQYQQL
jgi:hypothetical protein